MTSLKFLILTGVFIFILPFSATAESKKNVEDFNLESFSLRTPFKSQLPQKEKEISVKIKRIPKPVKIFVPKPAPVNLPAYAPSFSRREGKQNQGSKKILEPTPPDLDAEITGLIWNSDRPQAIVNGEVLEIGDEINGMKIVNIQETGIYVKFLQKILKIKTEK